MRLHLLSILILAGAAISFNAASARSQTTIVFTEIDQLLTTGAVFSVALGDLDGDNTLDAFTTTGFDNRVRLNRDGTGIFPFGSRVILSGSGSRNAALGDLNGDQKLDAVVAIRGPNRVFLNTSNAGQFSMIDTGQTLGDHYSFAVALGDLDSDGDLDIFEVNQRDSTIRPAENKVWFNDGQGNFSDSGQTLDTDGSADVALGDLDGDGDLDAYVGNILYIAEPDQVWLNDGQGVFTDTGQALSAVSSQDVVLTDLDGDDDLDVILGSDYHLNPKSIWLNDGSGYFTASGQSFPRATQIALGDIEGDGDLDIYTSINEGGNTSTQRVWLNNGQGVFSDSGVRIPGGFNFGAFDIALGDLDGDGDLDAYVAGNTLDKVYLNYTPQNFIPTDFLFLPVIHK